MKKRYALTSLFALALLLTSCDAFGLGHEHDWTSFYDNGDGTHTRMCIKDSTHIETAAHNFEEIIIEQSTDHTPGELLKKCKDCGHEETIHLSPTGSHVYDQEVDSNEYLYEKTTEYSGIYYKSSTDGAYGDPNKLFEKSPLPEGYSHIEYLQGSGKQFIDTGVEKSDDTTISYNECKGKNGRLPYKYQEVEYIEFTGSQFIDTKITGYATWDFSLQWKETQERQLMGYSGSSSEYFGVNNGKYAQYRTSDVEIGNKDNVVFNYESNQPGLYINGFIALQFTLTNLTDHRSFTIGALGNHFFCEYKLFSLKVSKNGVITNEFVPCYDTETEEIGLFDLNRYEFYGSIGTSPLRKGNDVANQKSLPSGYKELEYIESGGFQMIDTGYADSVGVTVDCKFEVLTANGNYLYGSKQNNDAYLNNGLYCRNDDGVDHLWLEYNWDEIKESYIGLGIVEQTQQISGDNFIEVINGMQIVLPFGKTNPSKNICIFGCFKPTGEPRPYGKGLRCYSFRISDYDKVVRDFVPAKDQNNNIGLYDLVEQKFYFEDGFIEGPIVDNVKLPDTYQKVDYINSDSDLSFDTGFTVNKNDSAILELDYQANNLEVGWQGANWYLQFSNNYLTDLNRHNIKLENINGIENIYSDNVLIKSNDFTAVEDSNIRIGLLKLGDQDSTWYLGPQINGKLYGAKLYIEGRLVGQYIPCIDTNTNNKGFYDVVGEKFLVNQNLSETPDPTKAIVRNELKSEHIKVGDFYLDGAPFYYYGKIYDAVICKDNLPVQKLIPALRNSDSAIGMYDLIGNKFYEQSGEFNNNGVTNHILDKGVVTKQATYGEDGEIVYTCSICGAKIHKKLPKLAYKVNFTKDEGVSEIRIHLDNNPENYVVSDNTFTRSYFTFNYTTVNGSVWFEIIFKEGYELDNIDFEKGSCLYTKDETLHYLLMVNKDIEVNITSKLV